MRAGFRRGTLWWAVLPAATLFLGCDYWTPATQQDCEAVADQYLEVTTRGEGADSPLGALAKHVLATKAAELTGDKDRIIRKCQAVLSKRQARCAILASTAEEMRACGATF